VFLVQNRLLTENCASRKDFQTNRDEGNQLFQKAIVEAGKTPGLLAYIEGIPVGWIAIEPRGNYSGLERSRILKPVNDAEVWSISCFYVDRKFRFKGISTALISVAVHFAADKGATIVEGYPTEAVDEKMPAPFVYTGLDQVLSRQVLKKWLAGLQNDQL
jgi:GNAT superfamily N-acetyltransferase